MTEEESTRLMAKLANLEDAIQKGKRRMFWMGWLSGVLGTYLWAVVR